MAVIAVIVVIGLAYVLLSYGNDPSDTAADIAADGGVVDDSANNRTVRLAQAIATAEGFYVAGSRPNRNNNPGDMTADLTGKATGWDGSFPIYATAQDGWDCLYAQVNAWLNNTSRHAGPGNTIADVSAFYTTDFPPGAQTNWANTVAAQVGATPDTALQDV